MRIDKGLVIMCRLDGGGGGGWGDLGDFRLKQ